MDQLEQSRVIDYNPRYHNLPPASNTKIVLASTPESVSYNVAAAAGISDTNLTYMLEPNGNYLDRCITLKMPSIPLKITRERVAGADLTAASFLGNGLAMCLKQFSILNAISSVKVMIDGKLTLISNDVAKNLQVISAFADKEIIHRFFLASNPDIFQKYADYELTTPLQVLTVDGSSTVSMRRPVFSGGGIFTDISNSYSSRIPLLSLAAPLLATDYTAQMTLHDQRCVLPLNLFGLPHDEIPLIGAKKVSVSITLYGNWVERLFAIKTTGSGTTEVKITGIAFNREKISDFKTQLNYTVRTGPRDSPELNSRGYAVELAVVEQSANTIEKTIEAHKSWAMPLTRFDIQAIPKKSYIVVKAKHAVSDAGDLSISKTADLYGRIDSLRLRVGNKETTLANEDASVLHTLALQHGLNKSYEESCYMTGFPVPIDFSETLGLESGSLVGTSGTKNGGSPSLWVALTVSNLANFDVVYEVFVLNCYQSMIIYDGTTWYHKSSFESFYDSDSGIQDLEEQLMGRMNFIGGRDGGGIGAIFSSFLPKIGNGLKNLVRAAFTDPQFRKTIADAWSGPRAPLQAAQNGGASFDNHAPFGGFYAHANNYNQSGGASIKQWSSQ